MKSNTIYLAALIPLFFIIFACQSPSGIDDKSNPPPYCGLHDYRPGDFLQIMNPMCAKDHIDNYETQINTIMDTTNIDSTFLIRGAKFSFLELDHIHRAAKYNPDNEISIMMSVDTSEKASMIFAVKHTMYVDSFTYYNFTQPCPDACPWPSK